MPVRQLQQVRPMGIQNTISLAEQQRMRIVKHPVKLANQHTQQQAILQREQQSQKLVQELIHAAIGCITYLRGLIPENSFCDLAYGGSNEEGRPDQLSQESNNSKKRDNATKIKSIQRGFSKEADILLAWIENGIFHALQSGYLRAFQLAVFLDKDHPEIIQEAYTFSVNYRKNENGQTVSVEGLSMTDIIQGGENVDLDPELLDVIQVRRSVKAMIRRLIVITQNLDLLPETRYITVRLYHTTDTPKNWAPPEFVPSTGKPLHFTTRAAVGLKDEICGNIETGIHSVQVRITSAKRSNPENTSEEETEDLDYRKRRRIDSYIPAEKFLGKAVSPNILQPAKKAGLKETPAIGTLIPTSSLGRQQDSAPTVNTSVLLAPAASLQDQRTILRQMYLPARHTTQTEQTQLLSSASQSHPAKTNIPSSNQTQLAADRMLAQPQLLQDMNINLNSKVSDMNGERTQGKSIERIEKPDIESYDGLHNGLVDLNSASELPTQQTSSTFKKKSISHVPQQYMNTKTSSWSGSALPPKLQLSDVKLREINQLITRKPGRSIQGQSGSNTVRCSCGNFTDKGDMIQCDICENWQHCECYGFTDDKDPRIGNMHICYTCLLSKNEAHLLRDMVLLARGRKMARHLLRVKSYRSQQNIADYIGIEKEAVDGLIASFVSKGYVKVSSARTKSSRESSEKYLLARSKEVLRSIEDDLLDPFINIGQHYDLPESSGKVTNTFNPMDVESNEKPSQLLETPQLLPHVEQRSDASSIPVKHLLSSSDAETPQNTDGNKDILLPAVHNSENHAFGEQETGNNLLTPTATNSPSRMSLISQYETSDVRLAVRAGNWS